MKIFRIVQVRSHHYSLSLPSLISAPPTSLPPVAVTACSIPFPALCETIFKHFARLGPGKKSLFCVCACVILDRDSLCPIREREVSLFFSLPSPFFAVYIFSEIPSEFSRYIRILCGLFFIFTCLGKTTVPSIHRPSQPSPPRFLMRTRALTPSTTPSRRILPCSSARDTRPTMKLRPHRLYPLLHISSGILKISHRLLWSAPPAATSFPASARATPLVRPPASGCRLRFR